MLFLCYYSRENNSLITQITYTNDKLHFLILTSQQHQLECKYKFRVISCDNYMFTDEMN